MEKVINFISILIILHCSPLAGQDINMDSMEITDFAFVHYNPNFHISKKYFIPIINAIETSNIYESNQRIVWNIDSVFNIKLISYSRFYKYDTPKDTLIIGNQPFCLEDYVYSKNSPSETDLKKVPDPMQLRILDYYEVNLSNHNYLILRVCNIIGSGRSYTSMIFLFKIEEFIEAVYLGELANIDDLSKIFMDYNFDGKIDYIHWNMLEDAHFYTLDFPQIEKTKFKLQISSNLQTFKWFWHPQFGDLPSGVLFINSSKEFKNLDLNILNYYH